MWRLPWVAFALAFTLTLLLTPQVRKLAIRFGAVAIPRERDIHKEPLPRWGGLAMVAAFLITLGVTYVWAVLRNAFWHIGAPWSNALLTQYAGILIAAVFLAIVGGIDDKFEVSAIWQTAALIAAGAILVAFGVRITGITNPFYLSTITHHYDPRSWVPLSKPVSTLATIIWVFGVAKTVDFIDGLDGLAAGVAGICALTLAFLSAQSPNNVTDQYAVTIIAATVVGVCGGFLRFNFNPASIIMGTAGAQFLGFVLAAIAITGTIKIAATCSVALPLLVLGVPVFDGIRVVASRILKRQPAHMPDKTSHFHHILLNKGYSQKRAVFVIYSVTAGLCLFAIILLRVVH